MGVVKICTYNCNSSRNNIQIIRELLNDHDILLLQELMLLSEDAHLVKNLFDDWDSVVFIMDKVYEGILERRPKKGLLYYGLENCQIVLDLYFITIVL